MDVLSNEHGKESSKSIKVNFDFDVPKINTQDEGNISRPSASSSSSSNSPPPESVVTKKESEFSLQTQQGGPNSEGNTLSPNNISPQLPLWSPQNLSPLQSPRVQVSMLPSGYDVNRLPAKIFSSKPSNQTEWSSTSNDSLFSLHLGNTSFSKDQFLMLYKSGELSKLDELITNVPSQFTCANNDSSSHTSSENKTFNLYCESSETASSISKESSNLEFHGREKNTMMHSDDDDDDGPKRGRKNSNSHLSYRSDESYNSTRSFQFPVLLGETAKIIGSPNVDSRRQFVLPQPQLQLQPQAQVQPLMHILRHQERSQIFFERKPKSAISRWVTNYFSCFSCCSGSLH